MTDDDVVAYLSGGAGPAPAIADAAESSRLERTRALLDDPALWVEPSPALERRVIDAVTNPVTNAVTNPVTDPVSNATPVTPVASAGRRLRNALLGAAAALLLAVGAAAVVTTHRDHPVEFAAALHGTELAPTASGSVTMTQTSSGWRIHLKATGLPRLDGGRYYQGWLKDAAGTLVPIGTFNQPADVTLWAGVPPSSYPTITITRQEASSGPASSGQKVLLGTSHRRQ
jgi:hypothetical protein